METRLGVLDFEAQAASTRHLNGSAPSNSKTECRGPSMKLWEVAIEAAVATLPHVSSIASKSWLLPGEIDSELAGTELAVGLLL